MHSQISTLHLIKRFVPYFKKYKGVLFLDLFCAALTTVCELVFPLIVRYITDMGMNHLESLTVQIILTLGGFYLVLRLIDTAANYFMANLGHMMGAHIETDMRSDLFAHLPGGVCQHGQVSFRAKGGIQQDAPGRAECFRFLYPLAECAAGSVPHGFRQGTPGGFAGSTLGLLFLGNGHTKHLASSVTG